MAAALNPLALAAVAALALGSIGCGPLGDHVCDLSQEGNVPITYTGGTVVDGVYMSSPWNSNLLYFPGGTRYVIDHQLGVVPRWWVPYLSFSQNGTADDNVSIGSGNAVELIGINAQSLSLFNDSCSDYWLIVVAGAGSAAGP